jgi:hypothetical protein
MHALARQNLTALVAAFATALISTNAIRSEETLPVPTVVQAEATQPPTPSAPLATTAAIRADERLPVPAILPLKAMQPPAPTAPPPDSPDAAAPAAPMAGFPVPASIVYVSPTTFFFGKRFVDAARDIGLGTSTQVNYDNIIDRQSAVPRLDTRVLRPSYEGITVGRASEGSYGGLAGFINTKASAISGFVIDSKRLTDSAFLTSNIPAKGDDFFASGVRATVVTPPLGVDLIVDGHATTPAGNGQVYTQLDYVTQANGEQRVIARHVYAHVLNFVAGSTDSMFSDPDSIPNTLEGAGPIGAVAAQRALLGYFIPFINENETSVFAVVSVEAPKLSIGAPADTFAGKTDFVSVARVPDFAAKLRWQDDKLGHAQIATIIRNIGTENSDDTFHDEQLGWGLHFSATFLPFKCIPLLSRDIITGAIVFGQGIGSYIVELQAVGKADAGFDRRNEFSAIKASAYFAGYRHYWTENLNSSVIYSQVDFKGLGSADTEADAKAFRHGRTAIANLLYQWQVHLPNETSTDDQTPHYAFTGVEYLYGEKETRRNGTGHAHRGEFVLGMKF